MKIYFDSTVLVSLLFTQSRFKAAADAALAAAKGGAITSTHALAEVYRTLTTLKFPIPPRAARELVKGMEPVIGIVESFRTHYDEALADVSRQGLAGAIVYDALHCHTARSAGAKRIVTRNLDHFRLFAGPVELVELKEA